MKKPYKVYLMSAILLTTACSEGVVTIKKHTSAPTGPLFLTSNVGRTALADRAYVSSFLAGTFGLSDVTIKRIVPYSSDFGWPCDPYYKDGKWDRETFDTSSGVDASLPTFTAEAQMQQGVHRNQFICRERTESKSPVLGPVSITRFALSQRACHMILGGTPSADLNPDRAVETAANSAVALAQGLGNRPATQRAIASLPFPDKGEVTGAYRLFFADRPLANDLRDALVSVAKTANTMGLTTDEERKREAWRFVLLTLCLSPEWQAI